MSPLPDCVQCHGSGLLCANCGRTTVDCQCTPKQLFDYLRDYAPPDEGAIIQCPCWQDVVDATTTPIVPGPSLDRNTPT